MFTSIIVGEALRQSASDDEINVFLMLQALANYDILQRFNYNVGASSFLRAELIF